MAAIGAVPGESRPAVLRLRAGAIRASEGLFDRVTSGVGSWVEVPGVSTAVHRFTDGSALARGSYLACPATDLRTRVVPITQPRCSPRPERRRPLRQELRKLGAGSDLAAGPDETENSSAPGRCPLRAYAIRGVLGDRDAGSSASALSPTGNHPRSAAPARGRPKPEVPTGHDPSGHTAQLSWKGQSCRTPSRRPLATGASSRRRARSAARAPGTGCWPYSRIGLVSAAPRGRAAVATLMACRRVRRRRIDSPALFRAGGGRAGGPAAGLAEVGRSSPLVRVVSQRPTALLD
jgi:hypothetical protein